MDWSFLVFWLAAWIASLILPAAAPYRRAANLLPILGLVLLFVFRGEPPALRLLASSLLFLYLIKGAVVAKANPVLSGVDRLLFATLWPGMDPENLTRRSAAPPETASRFARGLWLAILGVAATGCIALAYPLLPPLAVGWLGVTAILLTIHFGLSDLLTSVMWLSGRPVRPLFDHPFRSRSLFDFWTRRWNLPFVEMDRRLFLPTLVSWLGMRRAVWGVFVVSGLLHEMAISYPAGAGWGGPLAYFLLQAVGVSLERRLKLRSRLWAFAWVLLPLPLLFHAAFRETLIVPFFAWLHTLIASRPAEWYVGLILWTLPVMQLSVLGASYQVPRKLNWAEELPRLSPFNRKLMWTYGIFIVATVICFAVLTLVLHNDFLKGERSAIALAAFMCFFWCLRISFDLFYYRSEDWPEGIEFQVGHALLNALFTYLILGYASAAIWGVLKLNSVI